MSNKQKDFSSTDRNFLGRTPNVSWIPKKPVDLLLPYMEKEVSERSSVDTRRKKAGEIVEGYDKIIEECEKLENEISMRCKDVRVSIGSPNQLRAREACNRVFGCEDIQEITFEMYKMVIHALADRNNAAVPLPGE